VKKIALLVVALCVVLSSTAAFAGTTAKGNEVSFDKANGVLTIKYNKAGDTVAELDTACRSEEHTSELQSPYSI
jgi:hypothetical protein